eukprot:COSAG03_NODE_19787_length_330_cov_0.658009_1_plen_28_part_01
MQMCLTLDPPSILQGAGAPWGHNGFYLN